MNRLTKTSKDIILSILTAAFVLLMMALSQLANASGGKVNNPWQKLDADECAEWQIDGDKSCVQDPSDQSGSIFICEVLVVCPTEVKDD